MTCPPPGDNFATLGWLPGGGQLKGICPPLALLLVREQSGATFHPRLVQKGGGQTDSCGAMAYLPLTWS